MQTREAYEKMETDIFFGELGTLPISEDNVCYTQVVPHSQKSGGSIASLERIHNSHPLMKQSFPRVDIPSGTL